MYMKYGIDTSKWQSGKVDYAKAKQSAEAQKQSQAQDTLTQSQEKLNNLQDQKRLCGGYCGWS